eukprot:TRINITY_DN5627_c0_g1_i1.p1 TRINITY_DN5627_c0_g1~~TRINITY_DN5627_c0_g1_i1.p1  ORF type:complete len:317 (+),score=95.72 TRINITY_DN5627_c0_g1_i1:39-953(+)
MPPKKGGARKTTASTKKGKGRPKAVKEPEEWVVEAIRDVKVEDGVKFYLVKWENWPEETNTWEPVSNLDGCMNLVNRFEEERKQEEKDEEEVTVSPVETPAKNKKKLTTTPKKTPARATPSKNSGKAPEPVRAVPRGGKKKTVGKVLTEDWELDRIFENKDGTHGKEYFVRMTKCVWLHESEMGAFQKEIDLFESSQGSQTPSKRKQRDEDVSSSVPKSKTPTKSNPRKKQRTKEAEPAEDENADEEFRVESIVDHKSDKKGKIEYLIKWQDWDSKDNTWEPETNLIPHSFKILNAYKKKHHLD